MYMFATHQYLTAKQDMLHAMSCRRHINMLFQRTSCVVGFVYVLDIATVPHI